MKEVVVVNESIARAYVAAMNSRDAARFLALYTDGVVFQDFVFGHPTTGRQELEQVVGFILMACTSTWELLGWVGQGEDLTIEWNWKATHHAPFMGFDATDKQTEVRGVSVFKLHDGKIDRQHDYWDGATLLRQLGAIQ